MASPGARMAAKATAVAGMLPGAIVAWAVLGILFAALLSVGALHSRMCAGMVACCEQVLTALGHAPECSGNLIRLYGQTFLVQDLCLGWPEMAAAIAIPLCATRFRHSVRWLLAAAGSVGVVVLTVVRITSVCAAAQDMERAMFIHDTVAPVMTGVLIAAWLFVLSGSGAGQGKQRVSGALSSLALLMVLPVLGCTSFRPRDVAAWQGIQERYADAKADGLSDDEIEEVVRLCVEDAQLCEGEARFGRMLFAVIISKDVTDLEVATRLWAELMPKTVDLALNQERRARATLNAFAYLGQGPDGDIRRELRETDRFLAKFEASGIANIRNHARYRRASIRVQAAMWEEGGDDEALRDEVALLLAEAESDGLRDGDGEVVESFLGYGKLVEHGAPQVGRPAFVAREEDSAWWRKAKLDQNAWSVVVFTSADCGYCPAYWEDLMQEMRGCEKQWAPRLVAVVASDEIPDYLTGPGNWAVYRNRRAEVSWFGAWAVSHVPTAFILDGEGRFRRVFVSRDEIAPAIAGASKEAMDAR